MPACRCAFSLPFWSCGNVLQCPLEILSYATQEERVATGRRRAETKLRLEKEEQEGTKQKRMRSTRKCLWEEDRSKLQPQGYRGSIHANLRSLRSHLKHYVGVFAPGSRELS
mmetsp:Transcript_42501/g.108014  ORF Transcript_42501/g.108014 Transcript_42501/m.108014 type:complete len:112 (-) Transcript_42501:181-516(-)